MPHAVTMRTKLAITSALRMPSPLPSRTTSSQIRFVARSSHPIALGHASVPSGRRVTISRWVHVAHHHLHGREAFACPEDARPAVLVGLAVLLEERNVAEHALRFDEGPRHLESLFRHGGCELTAFRRQCAQLVAGQHAYELCRRAVLEQAADVGAQLLGDVLACRLIDWHGGVPTVGYSDADHALVAADAAGEGGDATLLIGIELAVDCAGCQGNGAAVPVP